MARATMSAVWGEWAVSAGVLGLAGSAFGGGGMAWEEGAGVVSSVVGSALAEAERADGAGDGGGLEFGGAVAGGGGEAGGVGGEGEDGAVVAAGSGWVFSAEPRVWFAGLRGDLTFEPGASFDVEAINADEVRVAPALALTYRWDRWTVNADFFYFSYDEETSAREALTVAGVDVARGERVGLDLEYASGSTTLGYRVFALPLEYAGAPSEATPFDVPGDGTYVHFDVYGGARLFYLDIAVDAAGARAFDTSEVFVDPVVGGRLVADLPHGFAFDLEADVGGFGAGNEFAFNIEVAFTYELTSNLSAEIGFRHLDVRFEDGGGDGFEYDVTIAGLFGSVVLRY